MDLQMPGKLATGYTSRSQQARIVTEAWGARDLYCPNCRAVGISQTPPNKAAVDYVCLTCRCEFQLKAKTTAISATIRDGAYATMIAKIRADETPNFVLMRYAWPEWQVRDVLLIPSFAFPESAVIQCKPLKPTAKRAGWVGCNISLTQIPVEARIKVVSAGVETAAADVRSQYAKLKPLREIRSPARGWMLDVLGCVRRLGKVEFTTTEAYFFADELSRLHPNNRHVREKIRQQLQDLSHLGLLHHISRNHWRIP